MTKITPDHLARGAFVYVRQSTSDQVLNNHESRRRQYGLADRARAAGLGRRRGDRRRSRPFRLRHRPPGLREAAGGDLRGPGRRRRLDRGLAARPQRARLAHAAGVLRPGRHADRRRGRRLRSAASERSPAARHEGHDERDGAVAVSPALARSPEAEGAPRRAVPHRGDRLRARRRTIASRRIPIVASRRRSRSSSPSSPSCRRSGRSISGCARSACRCRRPNTVRKAARWSGSCRSTTPLHHLLTNPIYAGAYAFGRTGSRITHRGRPQADRARLPQGSQQLGGFDPRPPRGLH